MNMINHIKTWIFNLIGYPSDIQNLLNYINKFESDIYIYSSGQFHFSIRSVDGNNFESIIFPTSQERASFSAGVTYGVQIMGGQAMSMTNEQIKEYDNMEKFSLIRINPKKMH